MILRNTSQCFRKYQNIYNTTDEYYKEAASSFFISERVCFKGFKSSFIITKMRSESILK